MLKFVKVFKFFQKIKRFILISSLSILLITLFLVVAFANNQIKSVVGKTFNYFKAQNKTQQITENNYKRLRIVLDPGHGGMPEKPSKTTGDHWDQDQKKFLTRYNFGAYVDNITEHDIVLNICKKTYDILALANTDEGWKKFSEILAEYGEKKPNEYKRVYFDVFLTRTTNYLSDVHAYETNINKHYRLFDSPEYFDEKNNPSLKLYPGRMSKINALKPELVFCVHVNSSTNPNIRGQASICVPSYEIFKFINEIKLKLGIKGAIQYFWILSIIFHKNPILNNLASLINDSDTYFGSEDKKKYIGKRWKKVTWQYDNDNEFWLREKSYYESLRREFGFEGYGGDNLYASEELIRFIRLGLWKDYINSFNNIEITESEVKSPNEYLGIHGRPFVSDWALPILVNAVTAYIELGYLENHEDRLILTTKQDIIAKALAVAAYSFIEDFKVKKMPITKEELINDIKSKTKKTIVKNDEVKKILNPKINELINNLKKEISNDKNKSLNNNILADKLNEQRLKQPLVLPYCKSIDFKKYNDYFQIVNKK